ncbi:YolD-like family protein [Bacillus sp. FSL K6-3431]|uniref:YolD-like family protein n=1 Tax=Bacillus sp. FSL K6-3431 TaxID=2921500 RepID=UPI0030F5AB16
MIRDRGTKKWTAMMLPEHVAMIKAMNNDYYKMNKPILDEYQLSEIDEKINTAVEFRLPVKFELWNDGYTEELEGIINKVDDINKHVRIVDLKGDLINIDYESIIEIDFAD